jgi:2,5-furandicarboxylate decarboxylase 1
VSGKADPVPLTVNAGAAHVAAAAARILALIDTTPLYYQDVAAQLADYDFQTVARALGQLHAAEKLWQDPRGRLCLRGSAFAAQAPVKPA